MSAACGRIYAEKSRILSETLRESLPEGCSVPTPRGGLQLLVRLPDRADDALICARLAAIGIEARPLSALSVHAGGKGLFLGFALPRVEEIAPAARRLAAVVADHLSGVS